MRAFFIALLVATGFAAALAGCSSAPQSKAPASVEDRKPGAEGAKPADSTSVKPVDVTGGPAGSGVAAPKDPAKILSKRSICYLFGKLDSKNEDPGPVEAH